MPIKYVIGDALQPTSELSCPKAIIHICNNIGAFGAGFVKAISKKWKEPENCYRNWYRQGEWNSVKFQLGEIQTVQVEEDIFIVNMIAQHKIGWNNGVPPIRYEALEKCLEKVNNLFGEGYTLHGPCIGCGLAGATWNQIEPIIQKTIGNLDVTIYDF